MELEIRSTIFLPVEAGEPYLVLASAFSPSGPFEVREGMQRSCLATSLDDAKQKCCELACSVKDYAHKCGDNVLSVHCTTCGTQEELRCGESPGGAP